MLRLVRKPVGDMRDNPGWRKKKTVNARKQTRNARKKMRDKKLELTRLRNLKVFFKFRRTWESRSFGERGIPTIEIFKTA